jgi:hypothetical protein
MLESEKNPSISLLDQVKYFAKLRYIPPTMVTAGKVIQAAGVNLFGVQKTFEAYNWTNDNAKIAITAISMMASICSTLGTRGIKNFEYFLLPNIYFTKTALKDGKSFALARPGLLQENYIISSGNNTYSLFKILDNGKLKEYDLNDCDLCLMSEIGEKEPESNKIYFIIENKCIKYRTCLTKDNEFVPLEKEIWQHNDELYRAINSNDLQRIKQKCKKSLLEITSKRGHTIKSNAIASLENLYERYKTGEEMSLINLKINGLKQFNEIKKQQQSAANWGPIVQGLYWFIYIPCVISMIFSTMVAFLAGRTLADEFGIPKKLDSAFIYYATASNAVSYCTFNLTTMNTKVTNLCESISEGSFNDSFKLPWKILLPVVLLTIFGMAANLGFAFFSMHHFFQIAALNQAVPQDWQLAFIIANVYVSIYTGIFNFAASALEQTKKIFPNQIGETLEPNQTEKALEPKTSRPSFINFLTTAFILTDTSFNCLGAFLGIAGLTGYLNPRDNKEIHHLCLALNIMMTVSYDYLTFGMSRGGCEKLIRWLEASLHSHGDYQRVNNDAGGSCDEYTPLLTIDETEPLLTIYERDFNQNYSDDDDEKSGVFSVSSDQAFFKHYVKSSCCPCFKV